MKFLLDRQLGFAHVTNATVVPSVSWRTAEGGVKNSNGAYIASSVWNECVDYQQVTPPHPPP